MSFDLYAELSSLQACPMDRSLPSGLAAGFVDGCSVAFHEAEIRRLQAEGRKRQAQNDNQKKEAQDRKKAEQEKNQARSCYMTQATRGTLNLPPELALTPWPPNLLHQNWLGLQVDFELLTPWYSKDDRVFHVLDNPVRKDRVFGVPFMAAASWKGMLRWACRMQAGLQKHLEEGKRFEDWNDPLWILHLFGNEKGEERDFHQGALIFYPTWFDRIGFEVINPHSRERRAGTQPIYYEVVPGRRPKQQERGQQEDDQQHQKNQDQFEEGGKGALHLLYAPWPGMKSVADPQEFIPKLLKAIENLLTTYGISAKRTVGWGTAEIQKWRAFRKGQEPVSSDSKDDLWKKIQGWFQGGPP